MNVKIKSLTMGAIFFLGGGVVVAQQTKEKSEKEIEEVVVVGYGTQKKSDVTASLTTVKGAVLADKPVQTFDQALAGRSTGVQITVPSGVLNAAPVFRIRGASSISMSSYPLVIIDGVPSFTGNNSSTSAASNPLASLNPADIESVDIAKDAAASAIYGSRASNGVVFITTKKGKNGKPRVNYSTWLSLASPIGLPETLRAEDYVKYKNMAVANNPSASAIKFNTALDANGNLIDTDWSKIIYRTGLSYNHNINISGGSDATSYYFSAGYTNQQGIIQKNDFKRINALFNIDSKVSKYVTVGGKLSFSNELNSAAANSGSISGGAFSTGGLGRLQFVLPSTLSPFNNDGSYNLNGAAIGSSPQIVGVSNLGYYNPQFLLDNNKESTENNRVQGNVYGQLKPFSWLTARTQLGLDFMFSDNNVFWSPRSGDGYTRNGYAWAGSDISKVIVWTNTLQLDKSFASHNLSLLLGNEQQFSKYKGIGIQRENISDPDYDVVQAGFTINNPANLYKSENYLVSFFTRLNYNFASKYFLSGNLRQDEYSALAEKKGVFWGVSGGWEVAKEGFWENIGAKNIFSSFKLRASYGKLGNVNGIGDFQALSSYGSGIYGGVSSLSFSNVGNNTLKWETSKKMDFGASFEMLKGRISADVTYYNNKIDGLILFVQQSPSTGLPTSVPQNIGKMYNKGWEVDVKSSIIETDDFSWSIGANASFNKNEVTELAPGLPSIQTATSGLETVNRTMPGYSLGQLFVVRTGGVDAATGKRIFMNRFGEKIYYQYYAAPGTFQWSKTADGTVRADAVSIADGVMYGNTQPKVYGGFDNTLRYKGFELNSLFTFQLGNYLYYGSNAGLHDQRWWNNSVDVLTDAWMNPGDTDKKYAKPVFNDNVSNGSSMPLDINVFKGDFLKLKTLTLAYNLPKDVLDGYKINNVRLYVSAQNLFIITKYPGPDPEVSSNGNTASSAGVDRNTVGNARTFSFGLNVGF
ncbi:SusC/RagA family TonB-linked outer membrane protein [Cloacibacterium sp.]|uniref:SusC/RagA family TonB-linked outer membrane protein n=1 Tax=Cloacibacterium sp. TaxID=1913682 RepID=UPI0039E29D96